MRKFGEKKGKNDKLQNFSNESGHNKIGSVILNTEVGIV